MNVVLRIALSNMFCFILLLLPFSLSFRYTKISRLRTTLLLLLLLLLLLMAPAELAAVLAAILERLGLLIAFRGSFARRIVVLFLSLLESEPFLFIRTRVVKLIS